MDQRQVNQNWTPANEEFLRISFPIHRACRDGDVEQLASLLSAGEVDLYEEDDFYGWSPIHWAAYFGKLACLRRLINSLECIGVKGCDLVSTRFSQSPAHLCAFSGHPQCLYWLVQSKSDVSIQDYMGETPLHKAARTGSMECVSLLVSQGAEIRIKNYSGNTPSEVAAAAGYPECADYLERAAQLQRQDAQQASGPANMSSSLMNGRTSPEGQPSVHNFISTNTYHSHPHVAMNGTIHHPHLVNGLNNNNVSEDCDMEMEDGSQESSHSAMANGLSHTLHDRDILLNQGVSQNLIPLAGRKRGREDVEEDSYKRARQGDNIFQHDNGTAFSNPSFANGFSDAPSMDCNENIAPSHGNQNLISFCQEPRHQSGFMKASDPLPGVESGIVSDRGHLGEINHNRVEPFSCLRHKETPVKYPVVNKSKLNGWLFNNGHMTDHMTEHMGDHIAPVSQSMVEHYTSVSVQEGYDSLLYNAMIHECHGS